MAKVIRVYGKADSYDIEFTPKGDKWKVDIPPDMTDGVYAVQLTAIDEAGESAYWVGELYMVNGVCCFSFAEVPYRLKFKSVRYETSFHKQEYSVSFRSSSPYTVEFKKNSSVQIKKKKQIQSRYEVEFVSNLKTSESVTYQTRIKESVKTEINKKRDFETKYTPKTEIFMRKGCCCE